MTKFPLLLAASVIAASTNSEPIVYGYGEGVYTKLSFPGVRAECGMAAELAKRGIVTEAVPYEPSPDVGRVQLVTIEPDKLTDTVSAEVCTLFMMKDFTLIFINSDLWKTFCLIF